MFLTLPERTRLLRRLCTPQAWTHHFLAVPSLLGVIDTSGVELIYPVRAGRAPRQIGKKGKFHRRWIVGGKLCMLDHLGLIVG